MNEIGRYFGLDYSKIRRVVMKGLEAAKRKTPSFRLDVTGRSAPGSHDIDGDAYAALVSAQQAYPKIPGVCE